jgi:hypothetical protein
MEKILNSFFMISVILCFPFMTNSAKIKETTFLKIVKENSLNITETAEVYTFSAEGPCSSSNCKDPYGTCSDINTCKCNSGWAQTPNQNVSEQNISCSYSLKSLLWFFAIELFTVLGFGHFYAARFIFGAIKLSIFGLLFILDFALGGCLVYDRNKAPIFYNYLIWTLYIIVFIFHTVDLILIGTNNYKDGNGYPIIY